ncbi:MAG: class I SAM-dependent rRNA methyltransferase [Tannerella sp.]|nr:class I SAM-dependent rRNA methyltransferase [Tannerella sp.]
MSRSKLYLKPKKEESLLRFHPWIFSGAVAFVRGEPKEGDVVEVYSADHHFLGIGHYQIGSIAVRILSFTPVEIDVTFWTERIRRAYFIRCSLGLVRRGGSHYPDGTAPDSGQGLSVSATMEANDTYRLVHGEGDGLPGLIIDVYAHTAVIQAHSVGMHYARKDIVTALREVLGEGVHRIYYKSEGTLPFKADLHEENEYLYGADNKEPCTAIENGLRFHIDWLKGQKTGFFIDQRDNRSLLRQYAEGRDVLNMFCYTGGFSVYALRGGASLVHSVDSSAKAIALTNENVGLNFPDDPRHQAFAEDAFKFMERIDNRYDLIVLDPPAFAKHKNVLHNALQGYRKLNAIAFKKIRPGGILFTFSCSQIVGKQDFRLAVFSAAAQSGRTVRILHQVAQPADHPINIYHPEGEYLKGLVLEVE